MLFMVSSILMKEKVKVSVSFENNIFDITKARAFVPQSPVKGWQVNFPCESFIDATCICHTNCNGLRFLIFAL